MFTAISWKIDCKLHAYYRIYVTGFVLKAILALRMYETSSDNEQFSRPPFEALRLSANHST
ncbi:hypothetical protein VCRA2119O147_5340001 [Vibrio crassostreae]|uniref:Uncharacterized protein n=1 Tax=Vibrio atlanticus (strain LGP32) TaxID=575788 RepID=B7VNN5_VIBA3|nr:hypothetical protein VCRA2113O213_1020001 [Vibrio crassostreae]CAV18611.1 Hypothetical protein VS_1448 [Vibrio atlanticus]CAK1829342.1 hypothetical protein VCRA2117O37_190009 [Vibrio crassostreae]CAK1829888.1 hypothetical protein VCRA2116O31_190010 [Vibrio crassostreae]CAK1830069.1 hypothetical protein VCRA2117O37_190016 [Vibrio crassostreae]